MMMRALVCLVLVPLACGLRGAARVPLALRGGGEEELFGGGDPESVEAKLRGGLRSAAKMMRMMHADEGEGSAVLRSIASLEAAAEDGSDASVGELLETYLNARVEQARAARASGGLGEAQVADALRQVANEALAYRASTRLPADGARRVLAALAEAAGASDAAAFEAEVVERSAIAVNELLAVLADGGNFVAKALEHADERIPALERDVEEDLGLGNDANVAAGRGVIEKLRSWQNDSAPLEELRRKLLDELERAEDHDKPRVADALRPVVQNVLGPDFSS